MELEAQNREEDMSDALQDLQALMLKARDMVALATSMNGRLEAQQAAAQDSSVSNNASESDATLIKSSLVSLGLPAPAITADMERDERRYHESLARELANLLSGRGKLMDESSPIGRPILSLDEVWCVWQRARGVALLSPADAIGACAFLSDVTRPVISLRQFASGLKVLHTPRYDVQPFAQRALQLCAAQPETGVTTLDVARSESLTASLVDELLQLLELDTGQICRDEGDRTGVRWWPNAILDFRWTDPN